MEYQFEYKRPEEKSAAEHTSKLYLRVIDKIMKRWMDGGSIFDTNYHVKLLDPCMIIPENETNFKHTWKTALHDLIWYHRIVKRCPLGGLHLEPRSMFDPDGEQVISSTQPELDGNNTDFSKYGYLFTKEWHPRDLDMFWKKREPGDFISEFGAYKDLVNDIKKNAEREIVERKYSHYLRYWDKWFYLVNEFPLGDTDHNYRLENVKKAEFFLKKCKEEGKPAPYPEYDKEKDPYWKLRTPTGYERLLEEQDKQERFERGVFFGFKNEYVDVPRYIMPEMMEDLSSDEWRSQRVRERIFATFPFMDKQILDPKSPDYDTKMKLVDEIIKLHPKYAESKNTGYKMPYYKAHPDATVQEWTWRLGAILNAFAPETPEKVQHHRMVLSHMFLSNDNKQTKEYSYYWADTQFVTIDNLLHCDNVAKLYGSWFALTNSGLRCNGNEEYERFVKVMELNHKMLHDDGKPLFTERDKVRMQNFFKIRDAYIEYEKLDNFLSLYKKETQFERESHKMDLPYYHSALWDPGTVSVRTDLPLSKEKTIERDRRDRKFVAFRTAKENYRQFGHFEQVASGCFYNEKDPGFFRMHRNFFGNNPRYSALAYATAPEQNESTSIIFGRESGEENSRIITSQPNHFVAITMDFNQHKSLPNGKYPYDNDYLTSFVPDANMDEIITLIPELKEYKVPFTITDTGLLTMFAGNDGGFGRGLTNFITDHLELFATHYFTNASAYMMGQHKDVYIEGAETTTAVKDPERSINGSILNEVLKKNMEGRLRSRDGDNIPVLDYHIVDLFKNANFTNRPNMEDVRRLDDELHCGNNSSNNTTITTTSTVTKEESSEPVVDESSISEPVNTDDFDTSDSSTEER